MTVKLTLLIGLLTVPPVLAGTSYIGGINDRVSVAERELAGADVLRPALHTLIDLAGSNGAVPDSRPLDAAVGRHPELGLTSEYVAVEASATGTVSELGKAAVDFDAVARSLNYQVDAFTLT